MAIRNDFKARRHAAGLTQAALEERSGLSRRSIVKLESGAGVTLETAELAAVALGCDLMLVPAPLAAQVRDFISSGGRLTGRPPGEVAPESAISLLARG